MLPMKLARLATRTLWVASVVLLAVGAPANIWEWGFFVAGGSELALMYSRDPAYFHRPIRLRQRSESD